MDKLISAFPDNISEAIEIAKNFTPKLPRRDIQNIVICGMGGSGIGGRLVSAWVAEEIKVPIEVVSDYMLPNYVSSSTLVIGSSYSGNTEETIACIEEAIELNAHIVGICSGGELLRICKENDFDVVQVPGGNPPRTALAFSLTQLLHIFAQFKLIDASLINELEKGRQLLVREELSIKKIAHEIAEFLVGNVGIIYGTSKYGPVLVRARQQFNENSKLLCWHHVIPEMNHNELVGWGGGDDRFAALFINANDVHPRNARRMEISKEIIGKKTPKLMELNAKGDSLVEKSIYLINVVDWASLYLSELKHVDPIDIEVIDYLKEELANFN